MAQLSLKHVYKIYDNGTKAVNDFNLDIGDNEFVVFVGPSGCGKSTTLRMIAGLEDITAGDFYIDGILANQLEPKDRDIAMVFQNYALYPHMSVYENMAFGLRIRHVPKEEIDKRVNEAARILDIRDQLDKKPKAMSGGQRQRVALGRAIVRKPKVFLLDEPLSNLDAKLRSSMRSEITRLHKVLGTTFIYVTHDQVEAMTMGTKIVVMKDGVIQQVDSPMNLYDYPANEFVAGFIGTPQMNFIPAKLSYNKNDIIISLSNGDIKVSEEELYKLNKLNILQNKEITLGIRPEHVKIVGKNDRNSYPYVITAIEVLGNESNFFVESKEGNLKLTIKAQRNDDLHVGDIIYLEFDVSKMHLFDKYTTKTLLERIPEASFVKAKVAKDLIELLKNKIDIGYTMRSALAEKSDLYINIPTSAVKVGGNLAGKIVKKEKVNDKWLFVVQDKDDYLFIQNDEYIDGDKIDYSIDMSMVDFYNKDLDVILTKINQDNTLKGKLIPDERKLPVLYREFVQSQTLEKIKSAGFVDEKGKKINIKYKNKKVFKYQLLGNTYSPNDDAIIKIYSLLGKKFELHDIEFIVSANKIKQLANGGFVGEIVNILDYVDKLYYQVKVGEETLLVATDKAAHNVGEKINLDIDVDDIGIYDVNFGVRLI